MYFANLGGEFVYFENVCGYSYTNNKSTGLAAGDKNSIGNCSRGEFAEIILRYKQIFQTLIIWTKKVV
jgi:hypothetical protein